jgi:hypothetical protein
MAYGVSFNIAPGVRIYRSGGGGVAVALLLAAIYAYLWFFLAAIYLAVFAALTVGFVVLLIAGYFMTKSRLTDLQARAVEPTSVAVAGRLTNPPTWGVYRVEGFAAGRRTSQYRLGNHPIRQQELVREFGAAELILLFSTRVDAEELKHLLESGQVSAVSTK